MPQTLCATEVLIEGSRKGVKQKALRPAFIMHHAMTRAAYIVSLLMLNIINDVGTMNIFIFQIGKLRFRNDKGLVQGLSTNTY